MALKISSGVRRKLHIKHNVSEEWIIEAFANRKGSFLLDKREDHKSDPPTLWFVAETDMGIELKVAFIKIDKDIIIKTAYQANEKEIEIYKKHGV